MNRQILLVVFGVLIIHTLHGQEAQSVEELFKVNYETPLTIDMELTEEEEETAPKKKKKKKNPKIFWGIKTKRGYTKTGFGDRTVVELFHYLKDKDYVGPDPYARDFYWYDFKKKRITNSPRVKRDYAGVLHGHYKKMMGDQVLEEGYFYKGMKHGRWVRFNRGDILQEKEIYWKGWPKESLLSYYDFERTKLKEMIPVHFGEKDGEYLAFHKNGNLAVIGNYRFDNKVGIWREYYPDRRVKREVQYPLEPFQDTAPIILKEWDDEGEVIYDRKQYRARAN
jgi:antitoxin component YwqK of YwqJK toxin-antitoxin module